MTLEKIISTIKGAGFYGVKIEMEAQLNVDSRRECYDCGGSGTINCHCEGEFRRCIECRTDQNGNRSRDPEYSGLEECSTCALFGPDVCSDCGGDGEVGCSSCDSYYDRCDEEPYEMVGDEFRSLLHRKSLEHKVSYWHAYEDGSVNTEITLTVATENIGYLPSILDSFAESCERISDGDWDVNNAGMHITLMRDTRYSPYSEAMLDPDLLDNYEQAMQFCIPAMYALASRGMVTREVHYRRDQFSHADKYSAIYTQGKTVLEFRIFDTCYEDPQRVLGFLGVIAKSLENFWTPTLSDAVQAKVNHLRWMEYRVERAYLKSIYAETSTAQFQTAVELLHPDPELLPPATSFGTWITEPYLADVVSSLNTCIAA